MAGPPALPELFDLDFGDFDEDLPLYERLARAREGPVLELGAGAGRAAISLARAGFDVYGIEQSEAMIDHALRKAGSDLRSRLHIVCGDIRRFDLGREFGLIIAGFGTFHHLLTPADQLACLRCVQRHLSPDGVFVCDLRPLLHADWEPGESAPLLHDWTRVLPRTGETVTKLRAVRVDRAAQVQHETQCYDCAAPDGSLRRVVNEVDLRFTSPFEMEALLRDAGLQLDGLYGGYDLTPYNDASDSMITIARRGKEPA